MENHRKHGRNKLILCVKGAAASQSLMTPTIWCYKLNANADKNSENPESLVREDLDYLVSFIFFEAW